MLKNKLIETNIATALRYKNFVSPIYLYLGKGEISNGIQYIWIQCRNCTDILCVDGERFLKSMVFKDCFCYGKTPYIVEEIKDVFKYTDGFIKYSDNKKGMISDTDMLIDKGTKSSTVLVKCLQCGMPREVPEEEYFNEKTNNYKYCSCKKIERRIEVGFRYGHLKILQKKSNVLLLECDCGNIKEVDLNYFKRQRIGLCSTNCVLNRITGKYTDREYVGKIFNNLKVLSILQRVTFNNKTIVKGTYWECLCLNCNTTGIFLASDVTSGIKTSCKCESSKYFLKYKPNDKIGDILLKDILIIPKKGTLWQCECPFCHDYFIRDPYSILTKHCLSCGCTSSSFGESVIWNYLNKYIEEHKNLKIYKEKTFDGLYGKGKSPLRFDFCVESQDNKVVLIEFDGEQHKDSNKIKGVKDKDVALKLFKIIQEHDKLKNEYAKLNNMPLLRIEYTKSIVEIETKVKNFLKREGL